MEGGLAAGMEPLLPAGPEQGCHKIALHQRVAARDGDSPARALVIAPVPPDDLHALLHLHRSAPLLDGIGGAFLRADQTVAALCPVDACQPACGEPEDLALRAAVIAGTAGPAPDALGPIDPHLRLQRPAFGVGAPLAPQGASLQKKLCPHPGAVVDGEALDIEHDAGLIHSGRLLFSAFVSAFVSASILPDAAGEKQWTTGRF